MNIEIEQGFPMDMAGRLKARGHHRDGGHRQHGFWPGTVDLQR